MLLENIHPFCRLAHFQVVQAGDVWPRSFSWDNRLLFVVQGQGHVVVENREYLLSKGDLLLIHSGTRYQLLITDEPVRYIALNFDFTFDHSDITTPIQPYYTQQRIQPTQLENVQFEDLPAFNQTVCLHDAHHLEATLTDIVQEYQYRKLYYDVKISAQLLNVLTEIARRLQLVSLNGTSTENKINAIITYLHENFAQPLTNEQIGKQFSFHPNYISQLMQRTTNMSLHQYLLHLRVSKARELLENTDNSITRIAMLTGFDNPCHFSKYFKKIVGVSPRRYRAIH